MGVLEFFGTLIKNDITATSIRSNFADILVVNHLLIDFNSIIHVSSQKILTDINVFLQMVLKTIFANRPVNNMILTEKFEKYNMVKIQKQIKPDSDPRDVVYMFQNHFSDKYLDKLIITLVINTVLSIIRTYCQNKSIQTLMLAIDGVPSKGKMVEQKQRRYLGAIVEQYKMRILAKYKEYLLEQPDFTYLAIRNSIKWSRNKITPGTAFMHKLVSYLKSAKIREKFKINRPQMEIVISDMYEVGEGEKKIVNYVNEYLKKPNESVMVYSPDADVILLCMLLPTDKLYMLRNNQQASGQAGSNIYDLIDIRMLKSNISYYINHHPEYSEESFDTNRINRDIVCISTLFGNDFVPKMETLNVKKGFQNIMDAYLRSLLKLKAKGYYLVKNGTDGQYRLNFTFLKNIIRELLPEEDDFIKYNRLYAQYVSLGQIKNVFDYLEINSENIVSTVRDFNRQYDELKNLIRYNGNFSYFENNEYFMTSLKKSALVVMDGQCITTSYLTNGEMIRLLKDYFNKYRDFPRLNINLHTWSHSINDQKHQRQIKDKHYNDYQKELYKFENLLDQYYTKFNHQPLNLTRDKIPAYYEEYFGIDLYDESKKLTKDAKQVMHDYLQGLLWVFNYYFNDKTYANRWHYPHERAPLMRHLSMYLEEISRDTFMEIYQDLDQYLVNDLSTYFNPIEQLIYVSPMTPEIAKLLPSNYREYIWSDNLDPFLRNYFIDIDQVAKQLWEEKVSNEVDCHSIAFFNKCSIKSISKPTAIEDKLFLKAIRKVKPNDASKRRSKSVEPPF